MKLDEEKLIRMSVDEARTAKWALGAEKYGPMFVGDPVVKLHSEGIDCLNYTDEIANQELAEAYERSNLRWHANRIVEITREIHVRAHSDR